MCRKGARIKYTEGYRQLQLAMKAARARPDVNEVRPVCMVADLVQLKLLLYAIGSGKVDAGSVKAAMIPWWTHVQTFMAPLGMLLCTTMIALSARPCL